MTTAHPATTAPDGSATAISDAEYLQRYDEERRRDLEEQSTGSRGGERALNNPLYWTSHRDDAAQMEAWEEHAWWLHRRGLWTGHYYALQPDGSWRPWLPTALRPEAPPAPGTPADEDWDRQEARRFPPPSSSGQSTPS